MKKQIWAGIIVAIFIIISFGISFVLYYSGNENQKINDTINNTLPQEFTNDIVANTATSSNNGPDSSLSTSTSGTNTENIIIQDELYEGQDSDQQVETTSPENPKDNVFEPIIENEIQEEETQTEEEEEQEEEPDVVLPCDMGDFHKKFLCLLNNYRITQGLNTLSYNSSLNNAALAHSIWMKANGVLNHIGENDSTFDERCIQAGTTCDGEILAYGFYSAQELLTIWQDSPQHNAIMLGNHTLVGLGVEIKYTTAVFK